ncbi:MAG: radical SAM protein [Chloroflexi bacterium]|nr:radical SAM protein [Chloroflexota bacterium]
MPPTLLLLNAPSAAATLPNREGTATFGTLSTGFLYPPHTLATTAASCRDRGIDVSVLDAVATRLDIDTCIARLRHLPPDIIGVLSSWGTLDADRTAIAAIRRAFPHTPLIALGAGIRYSADELLIAGATHVLLGDPELALAEMLQQPLPSPGLLRVRDILPQAHNHAGLLRHPQQLPRPAWELVPWQKYGFLTVFGSRGCDERCKYCAYVVAHGHSYRPRPSAAVADEMLWLQQTYQPARIMLRDPVFAVDRTHTMQLLKMLRQADFHTPWECESRPEHFDTDMLKKMAATGCTVIKLGIESADPQQLASLGRVLSANEAAHYLAYTRRVVADASRFGIRTRAFVMVGLPGQTLAQVQVTADYLRQLQPTFVHARPYVAYPHIPLGPAQPDAATRKLLTPLQTVADERHAIAQRRPGILQRLRLRLVRLWLRQFA